MPDDKQLKERLRGMQQEAEEAYGLLGNTRANTYQEAIDTIERLEAELSDDRGKDFEGCLACGSLLRPNDEGACACDLSGAKKERVPLARSEKAARLYDGLQNANCRAREAEAKLATLEAERERDAAVLEGLLSDEVLAQMAEIFMWAIDTGPSHPDATPEKAVEQIVKPIRAALQHAQEQVGESDE